MIKLAMNESTKTVAVAYANNTCDRRELVYMRENIFDAMPIGVPLTCTEIAERVDELGVARIWGVGTLSVSAGNVAQCMKSLIPFGLVEKQVIKLDTPYTFNVSTTVYSWEKHCWETVERFVTKDTITKYVRVV